MINPEACDDTHEHPFVDPGKECRPEDVVTVVGFDTDTRHFTANDIGYINLVVGLDSRDRTVYYNPSNHSHNNKTVAAHIEEIFSKTKWKINRICQSIYEGSHRLHDSHRLHGCYFAEIYGYVDGTKASYIMGWVEEKIGDAFMKQWAASGRCAGFVKDRIRPRLIMSCCNRATVNGYCSTCAEKQTAVLSKSLAQRAMEGVAEKIASTTVKCDKCKSYPCSCSKPKPTTTCGCACASKTTQKLATCGCARGASCSFSKPFDKKKTVIVLPKNIWETKIAHDSFYAPLRKLPLSVVRAVCVENSINTHNVPDSALVTHCGNEIVRRWPGLADQESDMKNPSSDTFQAAVEYLAERIQEAKKLDEKVKVKASFHHPGEAWTTPRRRANRIYDEMEKEMDRESSSSESSSESDDE